MHDNIENLNPTIWTGEFTLIHLNQYKYTHTQNIYIAFQGILVKITYKYNWATHLYSFCNFAVREREWVNRVI